MAIEQKKLQVELDNVFKLVNDWLKYAEQKLAGLIVLNGGILWGYSRLMNTYDSLPKLSICLNIFAYALTIGALLVSIVAAMPVLNRVFFSSSMQNNDDSSIYFGDIQKYSHGEYLSLLNKRTGLNQPDFTDYEIDQAKQIIYNSRIATSKFNAAISASWMTLAAVVFYVVSLIVIITW
ncbi:Pycsar system effector family protein [Pseudoalteromonas sp. XMcav11-Q]|uniref:Pycsar system effector family protein n=1 Tax=Pseudoalteromonas sp. XMcav11-Q TaxID=3136665 RepID=UPI0032C45CCF